MQQSSEILTAPLTDISHKISIFDHTVQWYIFLLSLQKLFPLFPVFLFHLKTCFVLCFSSSLSHHVFTGSTRRFTRYCSVPAIASIMPMLLVLLFVPFFIIMSLFKLFPFGSYRTIFLLNMFGYSHIQSQTPWSLVLTFSMFLNKKRSHKQQFQSEEISATKTHSFMENRA